MRKSNLNVSTYANLSAYLAIEGKTLIRCPGPYEKIMPGLCETNQIKCTGNLLNLFRRYISNNVVVG